MAETKSYRVLEGAALVFDKKRFEPGDEFTTDEDREWWVKHGFLEVLETRAPRLAVDGKPLALQPAEVILAPESLLGSE